MLTLDWLPSVAASAVVTAITGYMGVKLAMARVEERLASLSAHVSRIEAEIGTHETGMRGQLHKHSSSLTKLDSRVEMIERRLKRP